MFGQDSNAQQDSNQIPDQTIDAAMTSDDPAQTPASPQPLDLPAGQIPAADDAGGSAQPLADPAQSDAAGAPPADGTTDDLIDLKQQALNQLSPLLKHLDQSPEEKFRTTMMMIQASDNPELLKTAYEAAQAITNEKLRAQALLDVVNEINYFTQQPQGY